jgi:hypothetical protein
MADCCFRSKQAFCNFIAMEAGGLLAGGGQIIESGHKREPIVNGRSEAAREDGREGEDFVQSGADADAGVLDDRIGGEGCGEAFAQGLLVDVHAIDPDGGGAGVKAGHEVPGIARFLVAGVAEIGPDEDGGDVGEFGEEVLDDGAAIEFQAVVMEEGGIACEEGAQVLIANGGGRSALGEILGEEAAETAGGEAQDVIGEGGVAGEVLGGEEFACEVDGAGGMRLGHAGL